MSTRKLNLVLVALMNATMLLAACGGAAPAPAPAAADRGRSDRGPRRGANRPPPPRPTRRWRLRT